jgi:hypothetical protein
MKSDHIRWIITLTGDNIKLLSLYIAAIVNRRYQTYFRKMSVVVVVSAVIVVEPFLELLYQPGFRNTAISFSVICHQMYQDKKIKDEDVLRKKTEQK